MQPPRVYVIPREYAGTCAAPAGGVRVSVMMLCVTLTACATEPPPAGPTPDPLDTIWGKAIRPGDAIVLVPGTGSFDHLAKAIDALPGPMPTVDVHAMPDVALYAVVFEQAIGAVHRAELPNDTLTSGATPLVVWGVGFAKTTSFEYVSYEGLHVPITVIGGKSTCASGDVLANLLRYTQTDAQTDATDLYARTKTWLAANPPASGEPRNVIVSGHSWGGAVSEWLAFHASDIEAAGGSLADASGVATMRFTIAAGVPGFVPGYAFAGPGLRDLAEGSLYEIDRPDDPVHAMNPSGNGYGHQYVILDGDAFLGEYGVTTTALTCNGVPGACTSP